MRKVVRVQVGGGYRVRITNGLNVDLKQGNVAMFRTTRDVTTRNYANVATFGSTS